MASRAVALLAISGVLVGTLASALVPGCASSPTVSRMEQMPGIASDYRPEVLAARVQEYSTTFAGDVEQAADTIRRNSTDPAVRRNALLWKMSAIPAMHKACYRREPLAASADAWVFAEQMHELLTTGAASTAFGAEQEVAVRCAERMLAMARANRASVARDEEAIAKAEREVVRPWVEANPLQDLSCARDSVIAQFAELTESGGGTFDRVASMEEQVGILASQARVYAAEMPKHVRWQAELYREDLMADLELEPLLENLERLSVAVADAAEMTRDLEHLVSEERRAILAESARQISRILETVSLERREILLAVAAERREILEGLARERAAVGDLMAAERVAILAGADLQRRATLDRISEERRAVLVAVEGEMTRLLEALGAERAVTVQEARLIVEEAVDATDREVRPLINRAFLLLLLLILVGIVIAPIVAHLYVRVWPRRASQAAREP